jgi:excisionase family DNA binding protein
MTTTDRPTLLGTNRAAQLLGVTRSTIHRWVDSGKLSAWTVTADGYYLFDAEYVHGMAAQLPPKARKPRPTD